MPSFAKLNLTLRVTGRRDDGYHELVSLFVRIPSGEALFVTPDAGEDAVVMRGLDLNFSGENTVSRALRLAREAGAEIPPLRVEIVKALFPGSGLGSGSGNAASLLRWLAPSDPALPWEDIARRTGADVPFLFSGFPAARVSGIGERIEPTAFPFLRGCVAFPDWDVATGSAYAALDAAYSGGYPLGPEGALAEFNHVHEALKRGESVGLLPNDFMPPLVESHPQYNEWFSLMESVGALGWGITGSGGAAFALFQDEHEPVLWPEWVRQVLFF